MNMLTPLLGVDKSNPLLELLVNPEFPDEILVHYGMYLLEKVHRGADSIEEKLLAGRLYNAGLKRKNLVEVFNRDLKTIQGYGEALKSGDADRLRSVLSGQGQERKVGELEDRFIRSTFREVYEEKGCHANTYIREELQNKFEITLSRETIRLIINEEKARWNSQAKRSGICQNQSRDEPDLSAPSAPEQSSSREEIEKSEMMVSSPGFEATGSEESEHLASVSGSEVPGEKLAVENLSSEKEKSCHLLSSLSSASAKNSNHSPCSLDVINALNKDGSPHFLFHGGVLMVIDAIMQLTHDVGEVTERSRQWMASILCGTVNIEQSLELDFDSLSVILGQKIYSDEVQRQHLHQYATTDALKDLRKMNVQFIGADIQDTFLYDPHGIEYTGAAKLLKGWIGSKHKIAKATFQDFIHTLDGQCAVAFLDDNCDDLLRRFPRNIRLFRELLSGDQTRYITFVVDRAIYSLEDLQQYRKDNVHVITWEKGCQNPPWDPPNDTIETFSFVLYGNNCYDSTTYRVEYYSELWQKDLSFRRHLARLYKGDDCCGDVLPVICSNPDRPGQDVLEPILRRWVQENDILYLINSVGINEITSYLKFHYADIADQIEDRQVTNPQLRKICGEKMQLRQKLGVQLVKYSDRKRQFELEKEQLKNLEHKLNTLPSANQAINKEYKRLKASLSQKEKRLQGTEEDIERQKQHYQERIACLDAQHNQTAPIISRLEKLIEENYQKLNLGPKAIMDAIKIAARNAFGKCHEQFRPIYNNYRNDHKILRELIRAPALISRRNNHFNVALIPTRRYEKKQKKRIESFLKKLSQQIQDNPILPSLQFSLYRKTSRS